MLPTFLEVATSTSALDFTTIIDALKGSVNVTTIGTVVGAVLGVGVGLAVFWWGGRKIVNGAMNAFKTGKLKL